MTYLNPGAVRMYRRPLDELLGKTAVDISGVNSSLRLGAVPARCSHREKRAKWNCARPRRRRALAARATRA